MKDDYLNQIGLLAAKLEAQNETVGILVKEMRSTLLQYEQFLESQIEELDA